jgi:hypothetical protein
MQRLLEALKRDAWKLLLCVFGLAFGLYNERGVIVFFALAALIAWPIYKLTKDDDKPDRWG